ncbi:MAG: GGDEF domain-containing phosphodiesterase, partial [Nocardioidaceae bacterium]
GITASELLSAADLTMYDAKEAGRDRFALLDTTDFGSPRPGGQLAWADRITEAIADDRFVLQAQPVMGAREGEIVGAELLLRMVDEDGEVVPPGRFLYIAERLGLVTQLDTWVSGQAIALLEQVGRLNTDFHLEVNLSGHSIGDPELTNFLCTRIPEADIDPSRLLFEMSETAAVANIETARDFAAQLANLGCRFALDDFGAGFGSFYYLKHLPFDVVKIDGEFIEKSPTNTTDRLIVASIVSIARGLGKTTIAEFVSSEAILTACRELGVDLVQGYHVGRPAPLDTVLQWAQRGRVREV